MRWYDRLYVGERAKKKRYSLLRAVRKGRPSGYYVLTPASNGKNLLDIYPALTLCQPYYRNADLLIVGIASDYEDAVGLAARIIEEVYKKTGAFDIFSYFCGQKPG